MTDQTTIERLAADEPKFLIGSYVLETLTTGMYVEPRDCVREYVQNSFDAIRSAREGKLLGAAEGRIDIAVGEDNGGFLSVRDNGISIPAERAWETLTSIGASRKNARRQAGFRGIGRLAGIAYCDRLEFICKAAGEPTETTIVYDCAAIKQALRAGDEELEPVFRRSIDLSRNDAGDRINEHGTTVILRGLNDAPPEMRSIEDLADYLRIVAPVDFRNGWTHGEEIRRHSETVGMPLLTVQVLVGLGETRGDELRKPYASTMVAGGKTSTIRKISFFKGGEAEGAMWWGWYADTPLYGQITEQVGGIRLRVKNIQLGGADILTRALQQHAHSYARFATWHIGEIHVEGTTVFPNARRDGLEDSPAWRELQEQMLSELIPLVRAAYNATKNRKSKSYDTVKEQTDREIAEVEASLNPAPPGEPIPDPKSTERKIRGALRRIEGLNLDDYTEDQQTALREAGVQLRSLADRASITVSPARISRRAKGSEEELPHREVLDVVFEVLQSVLDTRTFNKARQALIKRFKDL